MTRPRMPICMGCKHLAESGLSCSAFAEIPEDIIWSRVDHRKPHGGDGGITFDPKTKADAEYAASLFDDKPKPA